MFNYLLAQAGIDPREVRLIRHQDGRTKGDRTPYKLYKQRPADFMEYQSHQNLYNEGRFGQAKYWAVFVGTPQKENLFVGIYEVRSKDRVVAGTVVLGVEEAEHLYYELNLTDFLEEYYLKLTIEWGKDYRNWIQPAEKNDKIILEIRKREAEPDFPGYLVFLEHLSDIKGTFGSWMNRLKEAKGVYIITCPRTGEHYIGSATGEGGFYARWVEHYSKGGDAIIFKSREPSDLLVSILEVAGSGMNNRDIRNAEYRWIKKLKPALNGHTLLVGDELKSITNPKYEANLEN